jgi:hypothetical protein
MIRTQYFGSLGPFLNRGRVQGGVLQREIN